MNSILKRTAAAALASALALSLAGCGSTQASDGETPKAPEGQASAAALDATYSFGAIAVPIPLGWTASPNSDGSVVSFDVEEGGVYLMRFDISSKLESENAEAVLREEIEASFPDEAGSGNLKIEPLQKAGASGGTVPAISYRAEAAGDAAGRTAVGEAYAVGSDLYRVQCVYAEGSGELAGIAEDVVSGTVIAGEASEAGGPMRIEDIGSMPSLKGFFILKSDGSSFDRLDSAHADRAETIKGIDEEEVGQLAFYSGLNPSQAESVDATGGEKLILIGTDSESVWLCPVVETGYWQGFGAADLLDYEEIEGVGVDDTFRDSEGSFDAAAVNSFFSSYGIERRIVYYDYGDSDRTVTDIKTGKTWSGVDVLSMYRSDEEKALSAGWYEGTRWVDGAMVFDVPYCFASFEETVTAPVEKTKDGYFAVDTSEVAPGLYVLSPSTSSEEVVQLVEIK